MMSGAISDYLGYAHFFIWVLLSTIPAFLVSWLVPLSDKSNNPET
jgi:PAT family beta-lactamase induction signal transducer AmpG